ncbi:MAG: AAA family ATPase [Deltaproteobacteria bacterium]|nr:AAA family ATPase [Deltaproteobacteria bacterium]
MSDNFKLPAAVLSPMIEAAQLGYSVTSDLTPLEEAIGQERAVKALEFGLHVKSAGFNIYVCGPIGMGKWSMVKEMAKRAAHGAPTPPDWCYVNNFQDPSRPYCLAFPAGQGRSFREAMAALIQNLRRDIQRVFESTKYLEAKAKIEEETVARKQALFEELTELGRGHGFGFKETHLGLALVPLKAGRPVTEKELAALSRAERDEMNEKRKALDGEIREFQVRLHALDHEAGQRVREMDREVVQLVLERPFENLRKSYEAMPQVLDYLEKVREDILANYKDFLRREAPAPELPGLELMGRHLDLTRYQVNLILEHQADGGAPVVDESHPTYANLVGKIERKAHMGVVYTDFTEIRAGAFLQASGGYLILNALDLLRQPFAWDALKRVIRTREVKIEDPAEFYGFSTIGLRPQPVPVDVKVILIGPPVLFHLLQAYEEDFQKIFKVKAEFDLDVTRDERQERLYARFVASLCRDEGLPHFGSDAVAELIRYGCRLAERQDRLSLRLGLLGDVVREASFLAQSGGCTLVSGSDVETAIANKRYRSNLPEQWIQDEIKEGTLMVDLEGEAVGQVNGLSLHLLGEYGFGRPCRITARTFIGTKGVIDIQREAELAGNIHSKGVMILAGFLAGKFAGAHPFALSATLTFEQTYSEVEGDSAAVAELAAVLSSLANAPLRQYLAVTGSVNQLGEVQPIGGVNEKIEGFFESCKKHGLKGDQGVIIPARNIKHLALRREVVEAVEAGNFTVYAVHTVEEALELLTGMPVGKREADGQYPENTLYGRVARRLEEMARIVTTWAKRKEKGWQGNLPK